MTQPQVRFVMAASLLFSALAGCADRKVTAGSPEPISVRVHDVTLSAFSSQPRYAATTAPETKVDLVFRTPGLVVAVYRVNGRALEPGDKVAKGAILAQLRTIEYRSRVEASDAQLANANAGQDAAAATVREAQAALTQSTEDLERGEALYKVQALTKSDLDGLQARHDAAQARLSAAQANAVSNAARVKAQAAVGDESRVPLSDTVIRAPFDGVIVARRIEAGSSVAAGTPAYTLADMRTIKLTFGVGDGFVSQFRPNVPIQATLDAIPGRKFDGRVIAVAPEADPVNRVFEVTAQLPNPGGAILGGMVASVTTGKSVKSDRLSVPLRAVRRASDSANEFAVLVVKDGKAWQRRVTLGPVDASSVAIESGLQPGDRVISDASARINDGDPVTVLQ